MPLHDPLVSRRLLHRRYIECSGFEREDGCFEVDGHLRDTKAHPVFNRWKGETAPDTPVHDMWLRLTVDQNLTITAVEAASDSHPFENCPSVVPNFQVLRGLRIAGGFQRTVKELLGNTQGCTHLVDLVGIVATAALQTIAGLRLARLEPGRIPERPVFINSCHGWAADGPVVGALYPKFYTGRKTE